MRLAFLGVGNLIRTVIPCFQDPIAIVLDKAQAPTIPSYQQTSFK
jgi:hypothetical protein